MQKKNSKHPIDARPQETLLWFVYLPEIPWEKCPFIIGGLFAYLATLDLT